ncbi:hypothetical protein LTS18_001598, partial [Coniosporium uncinatum]
MATNAPTTAPQPVQVGPDTPISVKIALQGSVRKYKIALGDLGPNVLPGKLRQLLQVPEGEEIILERFSDSAGSYITLDPSNPHVYKTLFRAAKAKLKLRLRATLLNDKLHTVIEAITPITSTLRLDPAQMASRPYSFPVAHPSALASESTLHPHTHSIPHVAQQTRSQHLNVNLDGEGEAPVPRSFPARESTSPSLHEIKHNNHLEYRKPSDMPMLDFFAELANISRARELALRMKDAPAQTSPCSWSVYCNACDKPMANAHYHCAICDDGDYDLCESCVRVGMHCPGEDHWLIKRFVSGGKVINSTTER